jgi:hypothetical protein
MEIKPERNKEHLRLSCIINTVNLPHAHVSATLVTIFREVSYKGYITNTSETKLIFHNYALLVEIFL